MAHHGLDKQSAETAEAFALHQAVKWALAQTSEVWYPVTIFYDCAGASDPASGKATASVDTKQIARATRALVHYAESHGVRIEFTHVHSHQGHALNEPADNVAKAGASFPHCSGLPFQLHQDWYQTVNATADMGLASKFKPACQDSVWVSTSYRQCASISTGQNAMHARTSQLSHAGQARKFSPKKHCPLNGVLQHWGGR